MTIYFFAVTGISMFCMNPVLLLLSLIGALSYFFVRNGMQNLHSLLYSLLLFVITALINPIMHHNGKTVLFVINHNPITWEAVAYGLAAATMLLSVLYWFRSYTRIMTDDKLLYLFGKLSPKLALVLSMGLRYVPMFAKQTEKINQTQTALGLYKEDNLIDRFRGGIRVFSVLLTWSLENGIITADSMTARGYGTGRRSQFCIFRMRSADVLFLILTLALFAVTCISAALGAMDIVYYPTIQYAPQTPMALLGCLSYGILVFLPTVCQIKEWIKWNCLQSKI